MIVPPRLLSRAALRDYLGGISDSTLHRWIEAGLVPPALAGTHWWDRVAVDRALDKRSGLSPESTPVDALDRALGLEA